MAGAKAIAIRYDSLRKRKIIPSVINPIDTKKAKERKLPKDLVEWDGWVNEVEALDPKEAQKQNVDFYRFESNRAYYARGHVEEGVNRLKSFVLKYPNSKYAFAAASLVIDTYIRSSRWAEANRTARDFLVMPEFTKNKKAKEKLSVVAADSMYKLGEQYFNEKKFQEVVALDEGFKKYYNNSHRRSDWLNLQGRAQLALNNHKDAMETFDQLLKESPKSEYALTTLALKAQNHEEKYEFEAAAATYLKLLKGKKGRKTKTDIAKRERLLMLMLLSGNFDRMRKFVLDKNICIARLETTCDRYMALAYLTSARGKMKARGARNAPNKINRTKYSVNKAIWAAVALENQDQMKIDDRIKYVDLIIRGWKRMDPTIRYIMLPVLNQTVREVYEISRMEIPRLARIKADKLTIEKRVKLIQKVEASASRVMNLPWARIQAGVLNEIAGMYMDLARDIQVIRPPSGTALADRQVFEKTMSEISVPFADAGKAVRKKAFIIASNSGVEDDTFQSIARKYFDEQPEEAKKIFADADFLEDRVISIRILEEIDPSGEYDNLKISGVDQVQLLKSRWASALRNKRWAESAYLISIAEEKKLIEPDILEAMKAVALSVAGARAEALASLESLRLKTSGGKKWHLTKILVRFYLNTFARKKVNGLLADLNDDQIEDIRFSKEEQAIVGKLSERKI